MVYRVFFATMMLLPVAVCAVLASILAYRDGWLLWMWLPFPVCWMIAALLHHRYESRIGLIPPPALARPQWTPRDEQAWALVQKRAAALNTTPADDLVDMTFYYRTAHELGHELAAFYHPGSADPLAPLTVREILAAAQLSIEDLADLVHRRLPASHLLTVARWRQLGKLPIHLRRLELVYWTVAAIFAPATTIARYATNRATVDPLLRKLQSNVLVWFAATYIQRVGAYLIELNSGRLRGGAEHWRATMASLHPHLDQATTVGAPANLSRRDSGDAGADIERDGHDDGLVSAAATDDASPVASVRIVVVGQLGSGKSTLINTLLGERRAAVDVLPLTERATEYRLVDLEHDGPEALTLTLIDTAGYDDQAAQPASLEAAAKADLVLMVVSATEAARGADRAWLDAFAALCHRRHHLRPPAVLALLTHVDLLRPRREWDPPYDWLHGTRVKEQTVRDAVAYTREVLGDTVVAVVPVCLERPGEDGVAEAEAAALESSNEAARATELVRALVVAHLDHARRVALVRVLHGGAGTGSYRALLDQLWEVGRHMLTQDPG